MEGPASRCDSPPYLPVFHGERNNVSRSCIQRCGSTGNDADRWCRANLNGEKVSTVAVFEQGLTQILQAAVTGLTRTQPYTWHFPPGPTAQARTRSPEHCRTT